MKRFMLLSLVLATGLGLGACEREERTAREELATAAQDDPGFATDEPTAVVPVPDTTPDGQTLTGNLAELGNSGASGVVTVTPRDGRTWIQLSVRGVQPETQLRPTLHRGGCAEPGELVQELAPVPVEPTGLATGNLELGIPIERIADGFHSVRIYPEGGLQVPPIACAELPRAAAHPSR